MVETLHDLKEEFVETSFTISEDCIFISDGFFNEFGLIENAAQTCSSIVGRSFFQDSDVLGTGTKLIGYISNIKKVSVFKLPEVGKVICTKAYLKSRYDSEAYSISTLLCDIFEGDQKLLACELNLFIKEIK